MNLEQIKVSVIVPMFNTEKFITVCIDSILLQTLKEFEIIVIDDCSTDRSFEVVRERYCDHKSSPVFDSRVKLFHNLHNVGVGLTRNRGIELATGKYIQFVDSDDAILPKTLETLFNRSEDKSLDMIFMNQTLVPKNPNFTMNQELQIQRRYCHNRQPRTFSSNINQLLQHEFIQARVWWMPVIKMIRRDLLVENQIYFPEMFSGEDMLFQLATLFFMKKSELIDAGFYIYRYRNESITHTSNDRYLRETVRSYVVAMNYLRELWKKLPMYFSRENQITLEIYVLYTLMKMHCADRNLDMLSIEKILDEVTRDGISIDPEVMSTLIKFMIKITRWVNDPNRGQMFELN